MIYVSSACVRREKIKDAVEYLARHGFKNIELSGGTKFYSGFKSDLIALKEKYGLNYLLHNYFPPPKIDFVINLASLNDEIFQRSLDHLWGAMELSRILGASKFGFHAGFFFDFQPEDVGQKAAFSKLNDFELAIERFCVGYQELQKRAAGVELYLENNVLSKSNAEVFKPANPFMLTDFERFKKLRKKLDFKLLFDIGHAKVSSKSLAMTFNAELNKMFEQSDYIHISDNNGLQDQNRRLAGESSLFKSLQELDWFKKTITLEMYVPVEEIRRSYELISLNLKNAIDE